MTRIEGLATWLTGFHRRNSPISTSCPGDAVDLVEITGVVKWFDVAKGFGFIVPDNGMQDVLLHVTCLRRDGYQTILEGTRIVALIQRRERGYQAFKILSMDQSTAVHPSQLPPVRTHVQVAPDERPGAGIGEVVQPHEGLRLLDARRGYGRYLRAYRKRFAALA